MTAFWDITPCLHHQGDLMMEVLRTSETSVYLNDTTWHCTPENCNFQCECVFGTVLKLLHCPYEE
jgi:hypothetical protein